MRRPRGATQGHPDRQSSPGLGQWSEHLRSTSTRSTCLRRELPEIAELFIGVTAHLRRSGPRRLLENRIPNSLLFPAVLSGTAARYTAQAADAETKTATITTAIAAHEGES